MEVDIDEERLLKALQDFTSRDNWDEFFKILKDKPFEWYGDWNALAQPLAKHCGLHDINTELEILVPGCGNSELSEKLYDIGYKRIVNIDFSEVVIKDMLRKHLRARPDMKWRVMDMTKMQFSDGTFDIVLDKGGLDALMEPKLGPKLGIQFLSEVKRVLKKGGKYACISLCQTHVIELLFSTFKLGWQVSIHPIPQGSSSVSSYHSVLVVAVKDNSNRLHSVTTTLDSTLLTYNELQVRGLLEAIAKENSLHNQDAFGEDISHSLEDLNLGAKDDMKQLLPGRRMSIILGEPGISRFNYRAVIMDSYENFGPFSYVCGVFLVPKARAHEWLFSSEEGQWQVVDSAKAGRVIMVFLEEYHSCIGMEAVQKDLSPLVEVLAPEQFATGPKIPFMMASDGVVERKIIQEVVSPLTGRIIVEDVVFSEKGRTANFSSTENESEIFRRLVFERCPGLIQSEALLKISGSSRKDGNETKANEIKQHSKSGKKKHCKGRDSEFSLMQAKVNLHVNHNYLASLYHGGMITGFGLIIHELEHCIVSKMLIRTVIIGLGAGLLPMFLHEHMPFLKIEAVELDPTVANLARKHFGFIEDERMELHIGNGLQIVEEMANVSKSACVYDILKTNPTDSEYLQANSETSISDSYSSLSTEHRREKEIEDNKGWHVIIIDADSDDTSTGLSCPHSNFVEEHFLRNAKDCLSNGGILILNLVSRSTSVHKMVISRMEMVFEKLFSLEIEEDVNTILFALPNKTCIGTDGIVEGVIRLEKFLASSSCWGDGPGIQEYAKNIKCIK